MTDLRLRCCFDGDERVFPVSGAELHIGRGSDNDIVLSDFSVSRRHAAIRFEAGSWVIVDLESTNGVQVNRMAVKKTSIRPGDRLKIGVFELDVEMVEDRPTDPSPNLEHIEPPSGVSVAAESGFSSATIIRSLADFSADYGLDREAAALDKRKDLDQAYDSKIFGVMTRLANIMISAESVDDVLERVLGVCFEALPVDRGFILLRNEDEEAVCEIARFKDRVVFRPESQVPVSKTMLETVMREKVALLTYDALSDQRLAGTESIRIHQIRSAMCAPLWSGEKIIGVVQVDSPYQAGTFNEGDIDLLTAMANFCAVAVERLRNAKKVEMERRVTARLERYHSPAVIEAVLRAGADEVAMEGTQVHQLRQTDVTILFADIVGFTSFSESSSPEEVAELLRGYFNHSVEAIFAEGGTLDKFIGDCVMAFFGAPMPQEDHALRGVMAGIKILDDLDKWNAERERIGMPAVQVRIAVNSGPVVVGDIGSENRVDYTVLGNTVNVAARLESGVAKPGQLVIGQETYRQLNGKIAVEALGEQELKGLQQRILAYRVVR